MNLNFKRLLLLERVHHDLDAARLVWFVHSCEEGPPVVHHLDLVQIDTLLETADLGSVLDLSNRFVLASSED